MTRFLRTLRIGLSFARNLGHGRSAVRMKAWLEDFMRVAIQMFARLRRTGWAILSLVMTDIFVLSDERMTPRRVAPSGRNDCDCDENRLPCDRMKKSYLCFPSSICR